MREQFEDSSQRSRRAGSRALAGRKQTVYGAISMVSGAKPRPACRPLGEHDAWMRAVRAAVCSVSLAALCMLVGGGCEPSSDVVPTRVVVYTSVDETFAREILDVFETRTGIDLAVVFDSEAGKTTGLVNKIVSEAATGRPRADVFWSSELFNTILLARKGLLEAYASPGAADIPARYKDSDDRWTALAARARVLTFDPAKVSAAEAPTKWEDLADPRFVKHVAIANPLFGTTRGHVAAMFALWGTDRARAFLSRLRDNGAQIVDSNGATVRAVMAGRARFGATDTDDVWVAQRSGASLDLAYPDLGDGGTLLVPCSVAIIKGSRNVEAARLLVDFLVSAEVERLLAKSDSRNIPVREWLRNELGVRWPPESKIGFDAVADAMDEAAAAVREILIR